ncbi:peptidoglycan-binding domain-containing protein [Archangium violaceum]|uniref:peptidoglycan-binding domain-containing protein n=1 Tax=Archangium violaceum TaxID=83451 RepID=UPI00193BDC01
MPCPEPSTLTGPPGRSGAALPFTSQHQGAYRALVSTGSKSWTERSSSRTAARRSCREPRVQPSLVARPGDEHRHERHAAEGALDGPTSTALQKAQKAHGLPATGVPDAKMVETLGLAPEDVFERRK